MPFGLESAAKFSSDHNLPVILPLYRSVMKTKFRASNRKYIWKKLAGFFALVTISLAFAAWIADAELGKTGPNTKETQQNACSRTSQDALNSCRASAQSAYSLSLGNCDNIPDPAARQQCQEEALATLQQAQQTCQDQFVARQQLCGLLGGGAYNPVIDP